MLFSVIVTIYNLEEYLEKCIDSILMQTYRNFEIILVDDGSTDKSREICDNYKKKDSRVVVLHKQNGGLISARVDGLMLANGEYSIFVDGDDWIETNELQYISEIINDYYPDMIEFGFWKEYSDIIDCRHAGVPEGLYQKEVLWKEIRTILETKPCFFRALENTICCKAVKTDIFRLVENKLCPKITWGEDVIATYSLLHCVEKIYISYRPLYHYVERKGSMMHTSRISQIPMIEQEMNSIWNRYCLQDSVAYKQSILKNMTFLEEPQQVLENYSSTLGVPGNRIVIFGKGVMAQGIIEACSEKGINIVAVIDSYDVDRIRLFEYDVIFIAISVSSIVEKAIQLLLGMGIECEKIKYIRYDDL